MSQYGSGEYFPNLNTEQYETDILVTIQQIAAINITSNEHLPKRNCAISHFPNR